MEPGRFRSYTTCLNRLDRTFSDILKIFRKGTTPKRLRKHGWVAFPVRTSQNIGGTLWFGLIRLGFKSFAGSLHVTSNCSRNMRVHHPCGSCHYSPGDIQLQLGLHTSWSSALICCAWPGREFDRQKWRRSEVKIRIVSVGDLNLLERYSPSGKSPTSRGWTWTTILTNHLYSCFYVVFGVSHPWLQTKKTCHTRSHSRLRFDYPNDTGLESGISPKLNIRYR